jgi:predicted dehydrogenase
MIHGTVESSGAIVNFQWHGGKPFPGTPGADWRILGEKGELRLTTSSYALNVGRPDTKLGLFDTTTGVLESVTTDKDQWDSLPTPAQNIARLYEAYRLKGWYPDFEWAVKRHEMIDELFQRFDASSH